MCSVEMQCLIRTGPELNVAALILAIVYPIEIPASQALKAILYNRPLPQPQEITPKMIDKCRKLMDTQDTWKVMQLAARNHVNVYELYQRAYG